MGTTKSGSVGSLDVGIQTTVMAIREELMDYFKGTCIQRVTENSGVRLSRVEEHLTYTYLRRDAENTRTARIYLKDVPILTVKSSPDKVIFHNFLLHRSPQLRKVKGGIEEFMNKFLMGVEKEYQDNADYII